MSKVCEIFMIWSWKEYKMNVTYAKRTLHICFAYATSILYFIHLTFEAHVEGFLLQIEISGKYNSLFDLCFQFLFFFSQSSCRKDHLIVL